MTQQQEQSTETSRSAATGRCELLVRGWFAFAPILLTFVAVRPALFVTSSLLSFTIFEVRSAELKLEALRCLRLDAVQASKEALQQHEFL